MNKRTITQVIPHDVAIQDLTRIVLSTLKMIKKISPTPPVTSDELRDPLRFLHTTRINNAEVMHPLWAEVSQAADDLGVKVMWFKFPEYSQYEHPFGRIHRQRFLYHAETESVWRGENHNLFRCYQGDLNVWVPIDEVAKFLTAYHQAGEGTATINRIDLLKLIEEY